jgi:hypothetical protein
MRISTSDLQRLYQARASENIPSSRKGCPAPDRLARLFGDSLSRRQKARIVDHISLCGPCLREFEAWRSLMGERDVMVRSLESWASRRSGLPKQTRVEDVRKGYSLSGEKPVFRLRLSRRHILQLAVLVIGLVLVLGQLALFRRIWTKGYRAAPSRAVVLVRPLTKKPLDSRTPIFQWKDVAGAERYFIEVFDEALRLVWKSPETRATNIVLPVDLAGRIPPGKTYFWYVTALLAGEKRLESPLEAFSIRKR